MVRNFIKPFTLLLIFLSLPLAVQASSCCGQSSASYTVLFLKQKLSTSLGASYTDTQGRVKSGSKDFTVWSKEKKSERQALSFNGAYAVSERNQFFVAASFLSSVYEDSFGSDEGSSLSDVLLGYSFEARPEYIYSRWKPVVYVSALVNLPTGTSPYDTKAALSEGAGVTGHDQFGTGLGLTLRKVLVPVTVLTQFKVMRIFGKDFGANTVSGFYDSSASAMLTYGSSFWGLGFSTGLTWAHLSGRRLNGLKAESSRSVTSIFSIQKVISEGLSASVSYSDQTLLGSPVNTLLNKVYSFNLSYNFYN